MNKYPYLILVSILVLSACKEAEKKGAVAEVNHNNEISKTEQAIDIPYPVYDYEGLKSTLNRTDGKTYVVNFWATWCKPCLEEMPYFQKTFEEQHSNGVELVLVSLDMPSMWEKRLVHYVNDNALKGEIVILDDPKMNEWIPKIAENWGGGIPATLIYNKEKRSFYERGFTYEELNNELKKFIP